MIHGCEAHLDKKEHIMKYFHTTKHLLLRDFIIGNDLFMCTLALYFIVQMCQQHRQLCLVQGVGLPVLIEDIQDEGDLKDSIFSVFFS